MKRFYSFLILSVLTSALLTGCGCTGRDAMYTTTPTTMPTIMTTPPTTAATRPTTEATRPTADRGNGPLEDTTTETTDAALENHTRSVDPTVR